MLSAAEIAALQSREITPEDYALLLRLEAGNVVQRNPPAPREKVRALPRLVCVDADADCIGESRRCAGGGRVCARAGAGPLSGSSIDTVPTLRVRKGDVCSICIEAMKPGDTLLRLPRCGHHFHASCVAEWLLEHRNACPLCMKPAV